MENTGTVSLLTGSGKDPMRRAVKNPFDERKPVDSDKYFQICRTADEKHVRDCKILKKLTIKRGDWLMLNVMVWLNKVKNAQILGCSKMKRVYELVYLLLIMFGHD